MASILAMFGLLALANAAPQYGYSNNFSGSKKNTVYETVCKTVYQTECKPVKVPKTVYVTECKEEAENRCTEQWICLDYPKPASLKQCKNKKWQPTGDCKDIYVKHCK